MASGQKEVKRESPSPVENMETAEAEEEEAKKYPVVKMTESDSNSSWNATKYQEKCEWNSCEPKFLEQLANCTMKESYKDGQFDDADESGNFVTSLYFYVFYPIYF